MKTLKDEFIKYMKDLLNNNDNSIVKLNNGIQFLINTLNLDMLYISHKNCLNYYYLENFDNELNLKKRKLNNTDNNYYTDFDEHIKKFIDKWKLNYKLNKELEIKKETKRSNKI